MIDELTINNPELSVLLEVGFVYVRDNEGNELKLSVV